METWTRGPTLLLGFAPRPACNHRLIVIFIFYFEPKTAREAPAVKFYLNINIKKETPKVRNRVGLYKRKKKQKGATTRQKLKSYLRAIQTKVTKSSYWTKLRRVSSESLSFDELV